MSSKEKQLASGVEPRPRSRCRLQDLFIVFLCLFLTAFAVTLSITVQDATLARYVGIVPSVSVQCTPYPRSRKSLSLHASEAALPPGADEDHPLPPPPDSAPPPVDADKEEEEDKEEPQQELPPLRQLTDPPYSLGPNDGGYDGRRAEWLEKHPQHRSMLASGNPRVLLITGSSVKPCKSPTGDHFLLLSLKNKVDYCRLHGIDIYYNTAILDAEMDSFWVKLPLLRTLMLNHPEVELLWWIDSDAVFTDMAFEVPWERYANYNLIFNGYEKTVYEDKNWMGLNAGSFFIRNCQWSLDFLAAWAAFGPRGPVRYAAGDKFAAELADRPPFEADDQSAIVYLLSTQQHRWRPKVFLELSYALHGYWEMIVDRYEEMKRRGRLDSGDHWPLVTHFVGCKPCDLLLNNSTKRCRREMMRAFNFADDQVLQAYGFAHESLNVSAVRRVRADSGGPPPDAGNSTEMVYHHLSEKMTKHRNRRSGRATAAGEGDGEAEGPSPSSSCRSRDDLAAGEQIEI